MILLDLAPKTIYEVEPRNPSDVNCAERNVAEKLNMNITAVFNMWQKEKSDDETNLPYYNWLLVKEKI